MSYIIAGYSDSTIVYHEHSRSRKTPLRNLESFRIRVAGLLTPCLIIAVSIPEGGFQEPFMPSVLRASAFGFDDT